MAASTTVFFSVEPSNLNKSVEMAPGVGDISGPSTTSATSDFPFVESVSVVQRSVAIAFLVPVVLVGFAGNLLVLASVARYRHLRTPSNLLVFVLAVSDIFTSTVLTGIVIVAYATNGRSFGYQHHGDTGNFLCQTFAFLMIQSGVCSTICMTLIAINRYVTVCRKQPGGSKMLSRRRTALLGFGAHLYGFAFATTPFFGFLPDYHFKGDELICLFDARGSGIYYFIAAIVLNFSLPYPTIIFCYVKIWMTIRQVKRQTRALDAAPQGGSVSRRDIVVTKSLFVAFLTYTLCITPHYWFYLMDPRKGAPFGVSSLWFANSAMNSLIYGWTNPSFRRSYGKLLRGLWDCRDLCRRPVASKTSTVDVFVVS